MEYTRDELINEVKRGSEVGKKVIEMEMAYLKALASGELLEEINQDKKGL